ncbi:response regulator transcription factor [Streptomyces sp. NBC_00289]|uniref:response regulator n=1 Tax=Streptomyces sp. NBC_00289 TaxID=2975703 RepID=UPI003245D2CA
MTLRVVVADDQVLVRTGFRMIIDARDDLEVVGEASDGHEAVRLTRDLAPDVVLMDVRMPVLDGIEATRQIAECGSRARVLVLTTWDVDAHVVAALRAGASGFLLKDIRPAELADAIRLTARGDALLAPAVMSRVLDRFLRSTADPAPPPSLRDLSGREREVLTLIGQALSNAEIAERLRLSQATVKNHVTAVLRKLGLRDRVQAVVAAYDHGLVRPRRP